MIGQSEVKPETELGAYGPAADKGDAGKN